MSESRTIDLTGCARCQGEGHPQLIFEPLTHPVVDGDGTVWSHWAPCPTNGEPILLRTAPLAEREVTLKLNPGEYACVISDTLAGSYRVWSDPVQIMVEPSRDGDHNVVEVVLRGYECPERHLDGY